MNGRLAVEQISPFFLASQDFIRIIKAHAINGTGKCHKCVKCGEPTKYS